MVFCCRDKVPLSTTTPLVDKLAEKKAPKKVKKSKDQKKGGAPKELQQWLQRK